MGAGNSVSCVKAVVKTVTEIAQWAGRPIGTFDVDELSEQIKAALKA